MRSRRRARPRAERRGRPGWRHWFPALVTLGLLLLAPALVHAQSAGTDSVTLRWTAVGDDGSVGTASLYDVRVSGTLITESTWNAASSLADPPAPLPSGTTQQLVVRGLTSGTTYYFAMRVRDDAGNWSALSNVVRWDGTLDDAPPPAPVGLTVERQGDGLRLTWSPSTAPDLAGYSVYRATRSSGPYSRLNESLLATTEYQDDALPEGVFSVWYQVTASDMSGNESARSASVLGLLGEQATVSGWSVEPAYPNPSRASDAVRIPVYVTPGGEARLDVVDAAGRLVRRIDLRDFAPGRQEVEWDGRNDSGRAVAPGPYRVWLVAGDLRRGIRLVRVP